MGSLLKFLAVLASLMAGLMALVVGLALWPFFYNQHVFPLGRLSKTIHIEDPCDEVERQFADYYRKHQDAQEIYFNTGTPGRLYGAANYARSLSLYHVNLFDDIQLNVWCGADDRVVKIQFIGD